MPRALECDLGRADEPWEGQTHITGQKNSSVKMGGKPAFQSSFLCKLKAGSVLTEAELIRDIFVFYL